MTERTFPATDEALQDVLAFVEEELEKAACPMKAQMQLCIAAEEIFINIAHYAYSETGGEMTLSIETDLHKAALCFTDSGFPFDPLAREDPDISLAAEDRDVGGLGIFMVKKTMDETKYERRDGRNMFTIVKKYR